MKVTIGVIVAGIGLPFAGAILFPVFATARESSNKGPVCYGRIRQLLTSSQVYAADNDDHLMVAETWEDGLQPYARVADAFHCYDLERAGKRHGFAMNRFLSASKLSKVADPASAHLIYESNLLEKNASEYLPTFPIPGRSRDRNVVGFVDGHAKVVLVTGH